MKRAWITLASIGSLVHLPHFDKYSLFYIEAKRYTNKHPTHGY